MDSALYSSHHCSPKDGGSTSSSPGAFPSPSSYTVAGGRKDPSVIQQCAPGLSGQQKAQESPSQTQRPSIPSTHVGSKSRLSDPKYRKTPQPLCSRQSPHDRSRANKDEQEFEHKKPEYKLKDKPVKSERKGEVLKTNRKGEERKRRKKKEEKRLGERKKKKEKSTKKEKKIGTNAKVTEKKMVSSISASACPDEAKICKMEASSENQCQTPPKHRHREGEQAVRTSHRPSTGTLQSSRATQKPCSKSENHKMPKKNSSSLKPKAHRVQSVPKKTRPSQTDKKPTNASTQSEHGQRTKPDDTLRSLLFKALAPLSTACSVSLEQPTQEKEGGQGGVLNAPDLQPVAVLGNLREIGDNLANTPPVLSWQGSPVSVLGEDEELEKGVLSRPVLQPSPTQCFSPPLVESESNDDMNKEPCKGTPDDQCHSDVSNICDVPCTTKNVCEKENDEEVDSSGETSGSLLNELHHHKAGLDDVFKSLVTFLEGQRVTCRGGPFGGPPASSTRGVKYSSSLELGPEIQCLENPDFSPKSDPAASSKPGNQSPTHTTSPLAKFPSQTDQSESVTNTTPVLEKEEETEKDIKQKQGDNETEILPERTDSSLLDGSLSAELRLTTTHTASFTSLITVSTKEERGHSKETEHTGTERKKKHKAKDGRREGEIKIKIKAEESKVIRSKTKENEMKDISSSSISRNSPRPLKNSTKGQIAQENQTPHGKDTQREKLDSGKADMKNVTEKKEKASEVQNKAAGNPGTNTSNSISAVTISTSKTGAPTPSSKPPCSSTPVDPLKLKALSMGLSKELKILLIKVESAGRQTFNISEVEEQRIPLSKISIDNSATEVIRACK